MKSKVFWFTFLLVVVLASSVTAVEINFWNGFTGPDGKGMAKMVDQFNQLHAGKIKVNMQVIGWGEYYQKIVTSIASGKAPEVGIMHVDRLPEFAGKGVLVSLNDVITDLGWSADNFIDAVWKAGIYQGERYGIPLDMHPLALYINKDLFREAGLDPEDPPKTKGEFLEVAKTLTKDTNGDGKIDQWGTAIPGSWPGPQFIVPTIIHQYGGKYTNQDVTEVTYDSPAAIEALQFIVDLIYKDQVSPRNIQQDGEVTLFRQGKLAMHFNGIWMINGFKAQEGLNFMSYPVPRLGNQMAVTGGSHNFVIFRQRYHDQEKRDAALEFIKYISNNSAEWATFGQIPALNSVRESEDFQRLEHQAAIAEKIAYLVFPPLHPALNEIITPLHQESNLAILGKKTPEEALRDAAKRAQKALDAYHD